MKIFFFMTFSLFILPLKASVYGVKDRLLFAKYYHEERSIVWNACNTETSLNHKLKLADELSTALDKLRALFPTKIWQALFCARFAEKNTELVSRLLTFWMRYKLMIIRDYIDAPQTSLLEMQKALRFLRTISEDESLKSANIFEMTMAQTKELGAIIANIKNDNAFIRAILDTPLLASDFQPSLKGIPNKIVSPLGYIGGNSTEYLEENSTKLSFDKKYNLSKLPPYFDIPTRLNAEGHPTFMRSQILRKLKSIIDLSSQNLYLNLASMEGNLGSTIIHYIIKSTLDKVKKNAKYEVLLIHNWPENSALKLMIEKRIEEEPLLKKALKIWRDSPASSNTFIADLFSPKPFALSVSFPLTDAIIHKPTSLQAAYLRGPIVAALFYNLTSQLDWQDNEWLSKLYESQFNYQKVGDEVLTSYQQNPQKELYEFDAVPIAELKKMAKNNTLSAIGSSHYSKALTDAVMAKKMLVKNSQFYFVLDDQPVVLELLSDLERLRKIGVQFIAIHEIEKFRHLNLYMNKSLVYDNSFKNSDPQNWFVPIHYFKSTLINKTFEHLKALLNDGKAFRFLSLQSLSFVDDQQQVINYNQALKESQSKEFARTLADLL